MIYSKAQHPHTDDWYAVGINDFGGIELAVGPVSPEELSCLDAYGITDLVVQARDRDEADVKETGRWLQKALVAGR